jgi:hypothetical protein
MSGWTRRQRDRRRSSEGSSAGWATAFRAVHRFVRLNAMSQSVTLDLPDDLARQARALAAATNRRLEDVLIDSVARAVADRAVESLPDEQVVSLCDATIPVSDQDELSRLLAAQQEGALAPADRARLEALMAAYRRGLVLKARALSEAVARGLMPRLSDNGG